MTNPAFLPNALLKEITGTEYRNKIDGFFNHNHNLTELDELQTQIFNLTNKARWLRRVDPASSVKDVTTSLPWWLECNPDRYPYWFGGHDRRNERLLEAMHSGGTDGVFRIADILFEKNLKPV